MTKAQLREAMLARRQVMGWEERQARSEAAQASLIRSELFARADLILLYSPFRGEVLVEGIAAAAMASGKRLALPRVEQRPRRLCLHAWSGNPDDLMIGAYGIAEPYPDWPLVAPASVGLVVVPGLAFDRNGVRLGYGSGYFDRTLPVILAGRPEAAVVGLAYSFQVVESLPVSPHDVPVDAVATESGLIRCRA